MKPFLSTIVVVLATLRVAVVSAQSCLVVSSNHTLADNLPCNCTGMAAAVEIQGPAALDLNHYTVSCTEGQPGAAIVQLTGSGAALLNGVVNGDSSTGSPCVIIQGPLATVEEVTVRDCQDHCMVIVNGATDATVFKNWIKDCNGDGITVVGGNAKISRNRLEDMRRHGVGLLSSQNQVKQNHLLFAEKSCISVRNSGDENIIFGNELTYCGLDISWDLRPGIEILGGSNGNKVIKNIIEDSGYDGILVVGDENVLAENEITKSEGSGIHVTAAATQNTVAKNVIRSVQVEGIFVQGDSNKFNQNKISLADSDGIEVTGDFNSFFGNHIEKVRGDGIDIVGNYNTVVKNRIRDATRKQNGIEIDNGAKHNILRENDIFGITDDCIEIDQDADNNTVVGNVMKWCGDDGIQVDGNLNIIKENCVKACKRDLYDENNNNCGTNTWEGNKANTGFPDCTLLDSFKNDW